MSENPDDDADGVLRCVGASPGDLLGYMDWDNPQYGYWAETTPRDRTYPSYHAKYEFLYQEQQFDLDDVPKLFDAFLSETDDEFKRHVVICISRLKRTPDIFIALVSRSNSHDTMARALALRALGLFPTSDALHTLLDSLGCEEPSIVRSAAGALAYHPSIDAERALIAKLHFHDEETVNAVLATLGRIGTQPTERKLLEIIEDSSFYQDHEYQILAALSAVAGSLTLEALPRLYDAGIIDDFKLSLYFAKFTDGENRPEHKNRFAGLRGWLVSWVAGASAVLLVFVYNRILWLLTVPLSVLVVRLIERTETPSLLFKLTILGIAIAWTLFILFLPLPIARIALRVWPTEPFRQRSWRYKAMFGFALTLLIIILWYWVKILVDLLNHSSVFVSEGVSGPPLMWAPAHMIGNAIQMSFIYLGYSSCGFGILCTLLWAHHSAPHRIDRAFVLFLRRFSSFADRNLVVDVIKSMPDGVPLAFIASRKDHVRNWDPFIWGFGGLRILRPFTNLPVQIRTTDDAWTETVQALLRKACCVVIDLSDRSPSVEIERRLVMELVPQDRVITLVDLRNVNDEMEHPLFHSAIQYSPNYWNSVVPISGKVGLIIWFVLAHETLFRWVILFLLPFMFLPSVSRKTRREMRSAIELILKRYKYMEGPSKA